MIGDYVYEIIELFVSIYNRITEHKKQIGD